MNVRVYVAALLTSAALFVSSVPAVADPSPSPSASPPAATLNPPNGWKTRDANLSMGPIVVDRMWVGPERNGAILLAHLDLAGLGNMNLDTLGSFLQQGLAANPGSSAQPWKHYKICGGKQEALATTIVTQSTKEDIVIALADRGYLAQYVRHVDVPADPAAVNALLTLCTP